MELEKLAEKHALECGACCRRAWNNVECGKNFDFGRYKGDDFNGMDGVLV